MKRVLICCAILCAAGCVKRATKFRGGMNNCSSAAANTIVCGGNPVAQVECFQPRSNSCRGLAVRYADGERVWLYQPQGFDPDNPEASASAEDETTAIQPEMARDASLIWFRRSNAPSDLWETYDPSTGIFDEVDTMRVFQLRDKQLAEGPVEIWQR
jgi:hypothetical protein